MRFQPINPGERFGRLTVIERTGYNKLHKLEYLVRCDCGKMLTVLREELGSGDAFSCGCSSKPRSTGGVSEQSTFEYTSTQFRERLVSGRVQVIAADGRVLDERPLTVQERARSKNRSG